VTHFITLHTLTWFAFFVRCFVWNLEFSVFGNSFHLHIQKDIIYYNMAMMMENLIDQYDDMLILLIITRIQLVSEVTSVRSYNIVSCVIFSNHLYPSCFMCFVKNFGQWGDHSKIFFICRWIDLVTRYFKCRDFRTHSLSVKCWVRLGTASNCKLLANVFFKW